MEKAIANVCRVDIITQGADAVAIHTTTADEAGCEPSINEGKEEPLRSKNRILAQNITEDLVTGYELTLKELTVDPDTFALIDGGTIEWNAAKDHFTYLGPETGAVINRKKFTADVWTEEKDGDGETLGYQRFRFPNCKGSPVSFSHKDGSFFAPEYKIKSRPKLGQSPVDIASFDALPGLDLTAAQLLAYAQEPAQEPSGGA